MRPRGACKRRLSMPNLVYSGPPVTYLGVRPIEGSCGSPRYLEGALQRIAVFVDAGYLYAQGSALLSGSAQKRTSIQLDPRALIQALKTTATECAVNCQLLRIYWYDGAAGGSRATSDQSSLAALDDVKLRLGFINSHGQQKGVDSLIVTDLIGLARLKSFSDALLLSGDEDVRIGVQIAQNHGVRVHLLGIHPARGLQSQQLMHASDTTRVWGMDIVQHFMSMRSAVIPPIESHAQKQGLPAQQESGSPSDQIARVAADAVNELSSADQGALDAYGTEGRRGIPPDFDGRLLASCGAASGRRLNPDGKSSLRNQFGRGVRQRLSERQAPPLSGSK